MGKPKHGPALYEVLRKSDPPAPSSPASVGEGVSKSSTVEPIVEAPRAAPSMREPDGVDENGGAQSASAPLFEVSGGQIRIALTSGAAALGVFAVACLLAGMFTVGVGFGESRGKEIGFEAGRESTKAVAFDEIQQARTQAPTPALFDGIGSAPVSVAKPPLEPAAAKGATDKPAAEGWVRGYTYVVVQDFQGGNEIEVDNAGEYLRDNGIETTAHKLSNGWTRLIASRGFNRSDDVQRKLADGYLSRIRELGKAYVKAGGQYGLEGYWKTLTADQW